MSAGLESLEDFALTDMKEIMERRKHKRFKAQEGVYVYLKDNYDKFGQLIDISTGGFAFLYFTNGEKINDRFNVNIFSRIDVFMRNMPFKTISDFSKNNEPPFSYGKRRRCGGQFDKLTQTQKIQLDYFIKSHTNE